MHITEARGAGLYALGGVVTEPPAPLAESYAYKSIITRTPPRVHERATHEGGAGEEDNREEDRLAEHTWNEVKPPRPRDRERRDRERERDSLSRRENGCRRCAHPSGIGGTTRLSGPACGNSRLSSLSYHPRIGWKTKTANSSSTRAAYASSSVIKMSSHSVRSVPAPQTAFSILF